ncbi:protein MAIN-LIKE 1-like [Glycine max]|uniref:protein MAIN-LIKE 1-like n=1 Tax=Glycine max TaxID=3847 RepID=UPI0003DEC9F6|nr:protein MAIN-LIKE 1-like [Glycine max]|eukprot:XP_006579173.1 protein MAIN-LIKE 1-like [Glycine max]
MANSPKFPSPYYYKIPKLAIFVACSSFSPPLVVVRVLVFFRHALLPLVVVPIFFRWLGNLLTALPENCHFVDKNPYESLVHTDQQSVVVEHPSTTEEELVDNQPKALIEEGATDVKGFPGGPHDTSVLSDFENHIALRVWNGEERSELKLSSHGRKMAKFGRLAPEIEGLVVASGLSPLIACSLDTSDQGLMFAFVECWHKETSSFHLPVGEVTITLDDVASLLHFPIVRAFHSFELLHVDDIVEMLVELLVVSAAEARAETIQCHGSYVRLLWLRDVYELKIGACD